MVKEIISNIRILEGEIERLKSGTRSTGDNPKPKIRRPGGDTDKIKDEETRLTIVQLWNYQQSLLDQQSALVD